MTTIHAMIQRHAKLHRQLDQLYAAGGDDAVATPAYRAASREAMDLEHAVVASRATTTAESEAKHKFIGSLDDGTLDLERLLVAILAMDAAAGAKAA